MNLCFNKIVFQVIGKKIKVKLKIKLKEEPEWKDFTLRTLLITWMTIFPIVQTNNKACIQVQYFNRLMRILEWEARLRTTKIYRHNCRWSNSAKENKNHLLADEMIYIICLLCFHKLIIIIMIGRILIRYSTTAAKTIPSAKMYIERFSSLQITLK